MTEVGWPAAAVVGVIVAKRLAGNAPAAPRHPLDDVAQPPAVRPRLTATDAAQRRSGVNQCGISAAVRDARTPQ